VFAAVVSFTGTQASGGGNCDRLTRPYMSTTADGGSTFVPFRAPPSPQNPLTWSIAALDDAGTLVMHADDALWGSEDDGCSWTVIKQNATGLLSIAVGPLGYAYAWQAGTGTEIYQIRHSTGPGTPWRVTSFQGPGTQLTGLGVDPTDPLHIRAADGRGQLYETFEGAAKMFLIGVPAAPTTTYGFVTAFDPNDVDHAVYGTGIYGGFVTDDGGQTWTPSIGLAAIPGSDVNYFNAVISPVDGDIVFAAASDSSYTWTRQIYASTDGGLTYAPVLTDNVGGGLTYAPVLTDNVGGVLLQNSPVMEADLDDANVLRFIYSVNPLSGGTNFYTYDLGTDDLTVVNNSNLLLLVRAIVSSRSTPGSLHVGFEYY
jgi:hypothetical protein